MSHDVILVDANDRVIGQAEKLAAHEQGLLHRAFSIMVVDARAAEPLILIHQRHPEKYHGGGLWTNACCSHPRVGETTIEAAKRRLQEEVGLSLPLKEIGEFLYRAALPNGLIEHEYDHVFLGDYTGEAFTVNPDEISAIEWLSLPALKNKMAVHPAHFSPWLAGVLQIYEQSLS